MHRMIGALDGVAATRHAWRWAAPSCFIRTAVFAALLTIGALLMYACMPRAVPGGYMHILESLCWYIVYVPGSIPRQIPDVAVK